MMSFRTVKRVVDAVVLALVAGVLSVGILALLRYVAPNV